MRLLILHSLFFFSCSLINAQQTANYVNNWHFGTNSALSFNSGSAINLPSSIAGNEAMSTYSDGQGNVLFYSSANQLWDVTNTMMPNGATSGDISSSCGTTICRVPGKCNQYYVFYIEHGAGGVGLNNSLHYSLVDMSLPGNGTMVSPLGDIVAGQKDILLYNADNLGEKILIVQQGNTENYWLIARSNTVETFYSFEVTSSGINTTPIPSIVSLVPYPPAPLPFSGNVQTFLGWLAINRDRDIIGEANGVYPDVRVYDFNNLTGILSNQEIILGGLNYVWDIPYGLAFSESGNSLYVGWSSSPGLKLFSSFDVTGGVGTVGSTISDYDISAQMTGSSDVPRAVVLGRDGKIYFGWGGTTNPQNQLGVINDPDNLAVPNIIVNGYTVTNTAELGLPNIPYYYHPNNFIDTLAGGDRIICPTEQATIGAISYDSIWSTYSWEPAAMVLDPNNAVTLTIPLSLDQQYVLHTIHACGDTIKSDTMLVSVSCILLSVELAEFSVSKQDNGVIVDWSTHTEKNSDKFLIQRSTDGITFTTIGNVKGAGNSQHLIDYQFLDRFPAGGINYYRLKQLDFDGSFEYSEIRTLNYTKKNTVQLYPNPASDVITIQTPNSNARSYTICDVQGSIVMEGSILSNNTEIELSELNSGVYFVYVLDKNAKLLHELKLVVHKQNK